MQRVIPTPRTLTLRFKHHRTTILIEVDPLQKLADVRAELLLAIQDTNPSGKLNDIDIPQNPDDILLGKAVDRNNLSLGFVLIEKPIDDGAASGKGKGKAAIGSATAAPTGHINDCPQGAGLRNADVVVFKFKTADEEEETEDDRWDVVIPTLENTYGDDEVHDEAHDEAIGIED